MQDREILRHDPHKLVEGALIVGSVWDKGSIHYSRGEFGIDESVITSSWWGLC